jgi:hypothetical protein
MQKAIYSIGITLLLLLVAPSGHAQISFITGYTGGYHELDGYETIVDQRAATLENPASTFNELRFLHGVNIGVNYRIPVLSIEAMWTERFRISREESLDPVTGDDLPRISLTERFSGPSVGLNFHIENFLIGGAVNYHIFRQSARVGRGERELLINDGILGAQVQIGYFKKLNRTNALSIHPYVYFPFSNTTLAPLDNYLNDNNSSDLDIDVMHFGLRVFLYNGPQRYD